jgi:hypothetical protein
MASMFYAILSTLKFRYEVSIFSKWPGFFNPDLSYRLKYKPLKDKLIIPIKGHNNKRNDILRMADRSQWIVSRVIDVNTIEITRYQGPPMPAPDNWYYRRFRIPYRERFPGSATIFSCLTDGFHAAQWCFSLCLVGALLTFYNPADNAWGFIGIAALYKAIWSAVHEYCFSFLYIKSESRDR